MQTTLREAESEHGIDVVEDRVEFVEARRRARRRKQPVAISGADGCERAQVVRSNNRIVGEIIGIGLAGAASFFLQWWAQQRQVTSFALPETTASRRIDAVVRAVGSAAGWLWLALLAACALAGAASLLPIPSSVCTLSKWVENSS